MVLLDGDQEGPGACFSLTFKQTYQVPYTPHTHTHIHTYTHTHTHIHTYTHHTHTHTYTHTHPPTHTQVAHPNLPPPGTAVVMLGGDGPISKGAHGLVCAPDDQEGGSTEEGDVTV